MVGWSKGAKWKKTKCIDHACKTTLKQFRCERIVHFCWLYTLTHTFFGKRSLANRPSLVLVNYLVAFIKIYDVTVLRVNRLKLICSTGTRADHFLKSMFNEPNIEHRSN